MGRNLSASLILVGSAWLACAGSLKTYRIETVAGNSDLGDGGAAMSAEIGNIQGVAADGIGNLYVSDTDHHRVRKIDRHGIITTVAGTGTPGFSGDEGPGARAQLNLPYGLAADQSGRVYVADLGNNRVRVITVDGFITTLAGNGERGGAGDGGPAQLASLSAPRNLALDGGGNLYISEFEGHRIRKVAPDGRISRVAGTGTPGFSGDGDLAVLAHLAFPAGLAVDRWGALFVADSQNQRVRRITPDGPITTEFGGGEGILLETPTGIAIEPSGWIYVADQSRTVRAYTPGGGWSTIAGTGAAAFSGDGGPALLAALTSANDLVLDGSGNLFVADGVRIRRIGSDALIQTVAGDGYVSSVGDGGPAVSARLSRPAAVALDLRGNLYIADPGTERVRKVSVSGSIESVAGMGLPGFAGDGVPAAGGPVHMPRGVAVDGEGSLLIAETGNHRIVRLRDGLLSTAAGTGAAGAGGEGQPALATPLRAPEGVCAGGEGILYIADTANHRVLRVAPDAPVVLVAGTGLPGDSGDGGSARAAQLNQPVACAVDPAGNLLIADRLNHRIRKVTPAGAISTIAGTGIAGSSGDEGLATAARLSEPGGVTVDRDGTLYISDTGNHRIRQVTPDAVIHRLAGGDVGGFAGDGGLAGDALLNAPGGLQVDESGNIYFADTNNNRVRRLTAEVVIPPELSIQLEVLNAASLLNGPVAPGEILTIFGPGIGPEEGVTGTLDEAGQLATEAGGTDVRFDGVAAPVFYAQSGQVNVQVPYTVAGAAATPMEIRYQGRSLATVVLAVEEAAPALFPVAANPDGSPNTATEPAPRGTILTIYGTGEGLTDGPNRAGQIAQIPFPRPKLPVRVTVAGVAAEILYAGSAPGLIGVFQVNARMPGGYVPAGPATMVLTVGGTAAPAFRVWLR